MSVPATQLPQRAFPQQLYPSPLYMPPPSLCVGRCVCCVLRILLCGACACVEPPVPVPVHNTYKFLYTHDFNCSPLVTAQPVTPTPVALCSCLTYLSLTVVGGASGAPCAPRSNAARHAMAAACIAALHCHAGMPGQFSSVSDEAIWEESRCLLCLLLPHHHMPHPSPPFLPALPALQA